MVIVMFEKWILCFLFWRVGVEFILDFGCRFVVGVGVWSVSDVF